MHLLPRRVRPHARAIVITAAILSIAWGAFITGMSVAGTRFPLHTNTLVMAALLWVALLAGLDAWEQRRTATPSESSAERTLELRSRGRSYAPQHRPYGQPARAHFANPVRPRKPVEEQTTVEVFYGQPVVELNPKVSPERLMGFAEGVLAAREDSGGFPTLEQATN